MMKLTVPKSKGLTLKKKNANTFYVSSEKNPNENYIVVQHGNLFFCQCNDFFGRRLQHLGSKEFELCKHGEFVKEVTEFIDHDQLVVAEKSGKNASIITGLTRR